MNPIYPILLALFLLGMGVSAYAEWTRTRVCPEGTFKWCGSYLENPWGICDCTYGLSGVTYIYPGKALKK
jgi:hypothetical protein